MKKNFGLSIWVVAVSLVFVNLVAPSSVFGAYFMGLGDLPGGIAHSQATGVSADGSVVVGYSYPDSGWGEAFRWDATNGMVPLGTLPDATTGSSASGVSADGSVVVGNSGLRAFRWDVTNGMVDLTDPAVTGDARGVSANGCVVVGTASGFGAFRWDATNGYVSLGELPDGWEFSDARGVSADGSVVVGHGGFVSVREAFRWDATNGYLGLGELPDWENSQATGVSADGSVVVGYVGSGREAFRWDAANGMVSLGQFPGGSTLSQAHAVSADGSVVVGSATTPEISREAFRWDATNGMQIIADLLESEGVDLTGWGLVEAYGVSADGSTIVGYGINPDGFTEAWVANISRNCEGDFDGDGEVDGSDLAVFTTDFGRTDCDIALPCEGDLDSDDDVDGSDLFIFAEDYGRMDCPAVCVDNDGDTYDNCETGQLGDDGKPQDCNDSDPAVHPSAQELCDGKDNDCNESTADGLQETWYGNPCDGPDSDQCLEGTFICSDGLQDCNDNTGDSVEICDGQDNNCDGQIDEGLTFTAYYRDGDSDGYGDPLNTVQACLPPSGYVEDNSDCDDTNPNVHPGASEIPENGIDEDCDGIDPLNSEDLLPTPQPDPCVELSAACKSSFVDPFLIVSTQQDMAVSTVVSNQGMEVLSMDWVTTGDVVDLVITFPDQEPFSYLQFEGSLPSLGTTNMVGAALVGLNKSNTETSTISALEVPFADAQGSFNQAGCDWLHDPGRVPGVDCSDKGICCDLHDFCIDWDCRGPNDSGNWFECQRRRLAFDKCLIDCTSEPETCLILCLAILAESDSLPCSEPCQECHEEVTECFIFGAICPPNCPGPSACCFRDDCGQPQQCINCVTGPFERCWVETKPENCPPGTAGGYGDPHLVTFDRLAYDLQAVGEFILTRSLDHDFEIQTRMKPWGNSRLVSINSAVAMNVSGDRVGIYLNRTPASYLNGSPTVFPEGETTLPGGGTINFSPGLYTVNWPDGSHVKVNKKSSYLNIETHIPAARRGWIEGLWGNFDDNRENDLVTRNGVLIGNHPTFYELYKEYAESWRISQEESLFDYIDDNNTETHTNRIFPGGSVTPAVLSESVREEAEQICRDAGVTDPVLLEACILDVGVTGDSSFADFPSSMTPPEEAVLIDASLGLCQAGGFALKFDGSNDLVTFGSVASLREHTIEAWVRPAATGRGAIVVQNTGSHPACTEGIILSGGGDGPLCYDLNPASCGNNNLECDSVPSADVWTHVAGTYDGELGRLYVNGELVATLNNVSFPNTSYLRAGTYYFYSGGQSFYGGELDELRIWDHARTREEIVNTMSVSLSGVEPGLRGYWKFDEGAGQDVLDSSNTGRNGVLGTSSEVQSSDPIWVPSEICVP